MAPAKRTHAEILERLPTEPGVYLMKDRRGKIIYVGKAANLRDRVRQYFQPASGDTRDFVPLLEGIVADIETVVTGNEKEALLLENNLIKQHQPRFNVKLTDDKNYLVLRLDPRARLAAPRGRAQDGRRRRALLRPVPFGHRVPRGPARGEPPLPAAHLHRPHAGQPRSARACSTRSSAASRPACSPCRPSDYAEQVRFVGLFLEGKSDELLDDLRRRMKDAAGPHRLRARGHPARPDARARMRCWNRSGWCRTPSSIRT